MDPEQNEPQCLLLNRPCCPFPTLNLFWKITIGATAVLMLLFSVTLFLMARSMDKYSTDLREVRAVVASGTLDIGHKVDGISIKIDGHKELTLANRVVTSEIRGALAAMMLEHGFKEYQKNKK